MADTRIVTGLIADPHGEPWPGFAIDFVVKPGTVTATETLPAASVSVTTGEDGAFATELVVGINYEVRLTGAFTGSPSATVYPAGTVFDIVVPDGDDPISLSAIRAAAISPSPDPTLINLLTAHTDRTDNPHQVTAAQTGAYTTTEVDTLLAGVAEAADVPTALTDLDTTVTGAQLDSIKTTVDGLGTAATADATDFATAAQGALADTAVQPATLAAGLAGKASLIHTHAMADVTGLADVAMMTGSPGWASGRYVTPESGTLGRMHAATPKSIAANYLLLTPVDVGVPATITGMVVEVTTASASGVARLGVFRWDPGTNAAALVVDAGTVATSVVGIAAITGLSVPITRGRYWLGLVSDQPWTAAGFIPAMIGGLPNLSNIGTYVRSWLIKASVPIDPFGASITSLRTDNTVSIPRIGVLLT